jgi:putative SOS response-associated peptidase YedK
MHGCSARNTDRWEGEAEVIESCSIIVAPANGSFGKIHDHMSFVLSADQVEPWLERNLTDVGKSTALLQPNADDAIVFHRVSVRVSNARNQGADLIEVV